MVYPGTLFIGQRGIPMHSYENRSQIRALSIANPLQVHDTSPCDSANNTYACVRTISKADVALGVKAILVPPGIALLH